MDEQLQELAASRPQPAGAGPAAAGLPDAQAAAGAEERRAQREAELLGERAARVINAPGRGAAAPPLQGAACLHASLLTACCAPRSLRAGRDTVGMSKEQKINFLLHLHEKLQQAAARLAKAAAAGAVEAPHPGAAAAAGAAPAACLTVPAAAFAAIPAAAHLPENHGAVANAVTMQLDAAAAVPGRAADVVVLPEAAWAAARRVPPAAAARPAGAKRKAAGKGRQSRQASSSTSEDEDW